MDDEAVNNAIEQLVSGIMLSTNFRRFIYSMNDDIIEEILNESLEEIQYQMNYGSFGQTYGDEEEAEAEEKKEELVFEVTQYNPESKTKECSICLVDFEETDDVVELKCSHVFHQGCIVEWSDRKPECPNCRDPITQ